MHQPLAWLVPLHVHSLITRAVAVMESCFTLIGAHQHGIAAGLKNGENLCFIDPLLPRRVQSTGEAPAPHNTYGSCSLGAAV